MLTRLRVLICLLVSLVSASLFAQTAPAITGISPFVGVVEPIGGPVTIQGSGFGATQNGSTVTFAGIQAAPSSWSDGAIVTPVPGSVPVGVVPVVVTVNGLASNSQTFIVIPVITTAAPLSASVGTPVAISGISFGPTQSDSTVSFNGVNGTPTSWADGSITVPVPLGASDGPITVTVNGFATNGFWFYIIPAIRSLQPASGVVGTQVTITGSGFGASQGFGGVTFNGISATVLPQNWTDTSIVTTVPVGATTGPVVVTSADLVIGTGTNFSVGPALVSLFVFPGNPPMPLNGSQQFTAIGVLSDGTISDYTATAVWNSSNTSVVSVNNTGLAQAAGIGTANVTATVTGISGTATVTVQAVPTITALSTSSGPPGATVTVTGSGFGSAQGTLTFNGTTASTTWSDGSITATVPEGASTGNVVALTASGLSSNSVPFTVSINPVLSGQFGQTLTAVTLTSPFALDWEHWGTSNDQPIVRMNGVTPLISDLTAIGSNSPAPFADGEIEYIWTDGDVLTIAQRTMTGVFVNGAGNGFSLTVPAGTAPETLVLYVGVDSGQGQLTASLSDNSAGPFVDTSLNSGQGSTQNGTYTIDFRASQPRQALNISYVLLTDKGNGTNLLGDVSLQSAVLLPRLPAVSLAAPLDGQTFTYPSAISASVNASQIDLAISKVDLLTDSQSPIELTAAPYSFSLNSLTAGDHVISATATDANGLVGMSNTALIAEVQGGGSLTASIAAPTNIDISAGTTDWVHWGNIDAPNNVDRKAGVTPEISNFTTLANGDVFVADDSSRGGVSYSWSGGAPTATQTGTTTQVFMQGYKNGFTLSIPADTTVRTANIYLGYGFGSSQLRASLSDGSAAPWVNVFSTTDFYDEKVVTLQFQAASAGQTLTISDQVIVDDGFAYVDLEAVTVTDQNPPVINAVSPPSAGPGTMVTIAGSNFGDNPGTVTLSGTPLTVNTWSNSTITATLSGGYASGPIVVSQGLADSNGFAFTYLGPVITSIIPNAGPPGTLVTIATQNLGQGSVTVTFGGVPANVISQGPNAIHVTVPSGLSFGPTQIVVQASTGTTNGIQFDVVQAPVITSLTPNFGITGQTVRIFGSNFGPLPGGSTVNFGAINAPPLSWSESVIETQVPAGFFGGVVTVTVGGQTSNGVPFEVPIRCLTDCNAKRSSIDISPQNLAIVVGDSVNLNVVDNLGESVSFPTFTLSDSTLGSITPGNNISTFAAVAPGTETVSVTAGGLTASTTITIYAGPTLPAGTIKWQLPSSIVGGAAANFVQAQPALNSNTATFADDLSDPFHNVIIRALDVNGMQLWAWPTQTPYSTLFFSPEAPTPNGGFVYTDTVSINGIDQNGHPLWSYPHPQFTSEPLTVGYDGTVYALVDFGTGVFHLVALDGQTGKEKFRIPLPRGRATVTGTVNNVGCPSFCWPSSAPPPTQDSDGPSNAIFSRPIVLADGSVNIAVWGQLSSSIISPNSHQSTPPCTSDEFGRLDLNPSDNCNGNNTVYCPIEVSQCWAATVNQVEGTNGQEIDLVNIQPDGSFKQYQLAQNQLTCDIFGFAYSWVQNDQSGPVSGEFHSASGGVAFDGHQYSNQDSLWAQGSGCVSGLSGPNGFDLMVVPNGTGGVLVASETLEPGNPIWIYNVANPSVSGNGSVITINNLNTLNRIVIGENGIAFAAGTWNFFETPRLVSFNLSDGSPNWSYDSQFGGPGTPEAPGGVDIVAAGPNGSLYATEGDLFNQIPFVAFTLDGSGNRTDNPTSSQAVTYVASAGIGSSIWLGSNDTSVTAVEYPDFGLGLPEMMMQSGGPIPLPGITAYVATLVVPVIGSYSTPVPSGTEDKAAAPRAGLYALSQADFSNSACTTFLQGLAFQSHTTLDNLVAEVHKTANQAQDYVFDGPSSTVILDQDKFPNVASPSVQTVGQFFGVSNGREALSQFNGLAIFLRLGDWSPFLNGLFSSYISSGKVNSYGMGTLMHEILHKKMISGGFRHDQLELALKISTLHSDCNSGALKNYCSYEIASRCFPSLK